MVSSVLDLWIVIWVRKNNRSTYLGQSASLRRDDAERKVLCLVRFYDRGIAGQLTVTLERAKVDNEPLVNKKVQHLRDHREGFGSSKHTTKAFLCCSLLFRKWAQLLSWFPHYNPLTPCSYTMISVNQFKEPQDSSE